MLVGIGAGENCCVTMAASGKIIKMEVDFSDTVDKKLPEYRELAQVHAH